MVLLSFLPVKRMAHYECALITALLISRRGGIRIPYHASMTYWIV